MFNINYIKKIFKLLEAKEINYIYFIAFLAIISFFLEMISLGSLLPLMTLITSPVDAMNNDFFNRFSIFFDNYEKNSLISSAIIIIIFIFLIKNIFLGFLTWHLNNFIFSLQANLSNKLFNIYLKQNWKFHINNNSSLLISNILNEIKIFSSNCVGQMINIIVEIFIFMGVLAVLFVINPIASILVAFIITTLLVIYFSITKVFISKWGKMRQFHDGKKIQFLQEGLGAIKDLKVLGRESQFLKIFTYHNNTGANVGKYQSTLSQMPRLGLEFIAILFMCLLFIFYMNSGVSINEVIPIIGVYLFAIIRLLPSSNKLIGAFKSFKFAQPATDKLISQFNQLEGFIDINKKEASLNFVDSLEFENVTFLYDDERRSGIKNINLNIKRNSVIGIIGETGAGKSTLIDLIIGLHKPQSGTIRVDNVDIQTDIRSWQSKLGYVPQEIYLRDDSLKRNICLGLDDDEIDEEKLLKSLKLAKLEDFVLNLPKKMDTVVGERGVQISGGQLQRVGIARALYNSPEVLIFDEATSSLDLETENTILNEINYMKNTKTVIIITHRLSSLTICDEVYEISSGSLKRK